MTYYLDLTYHDGTGAPFRFAQIHVKNHTIDSDGEICVSPQCARIEELDYHVDKLIAELEKIRRKARVRFRRPRAAPHLTRPMSEGRN